MSKVQEFMDLTNTDKDTAQYYLEVAGNNLDSAVDIFFDSGAAPQGKPFKPQTKPFPVDEKIPNDSKSNFQKPVPPKMPIGKLPDWAKEDKNQDKSPVKGNVLQDIVDLGKKGSAEASDSKGTKSGKITLWKNGFQVDDGEFRPLGVPENDAFLAQVRNGQVPKELWSRGADLEIDLEDNTEKEFKAPPKPKNPFEGPSKTLDGGSNVKSQKSVQPPKSVPAQNETPKTNFVSPGQTGTKVLIPSADGKFFAISVPVTATVGELKEFIRAARPDLGKKPIKLSTAMPPKILDNDKATVLDENLKMAKLLF